MMWRWICFRWTAARHRWLKPLCSVDTQRWSIGPPTTAGSSPRWTSHRSGCSITSAEWKPSRRRSITEPLRTGNTAVSPADVIELIHMIHLYDSVPFSQCESALNSLYIFALQSFNFSSFGLPGLLQSSLYISHIINKYWIGFSFNQHRFCVSFWTGSSKDSLIWSQFLSEQTNICG